MRDIAIEISGNAQAQLKTLSDPFKVYPVLMKTMDRANQSAVARIQSAYMSLPKSGPTSPGGLRVITNRLRGSVRATKTIVNNGGLESNIGSNVVYAGILEDGGSIQHRARARKLHWIDGRFATAKDWNKHRKKFTGAERRVVYGRAYTQRIKGRRYAFRGIIDRLPMTVAELEGAILKMQPIS